MPGEIVPHTQKPEKSDIIRFRYTSLELGNPDAIHIILEEPTEFRNLMPNALPDWQLPVLDMTLHAKRGLTPESLELHATSEFSPIDILHESEEKPWQESLKAALYDMYPDDVRSKMPHDSDSLYLRIADRFYARVATSAEVKRCFLEIDLVPDEDFNKYAGRVAGDDLSDTDIDPYLVLREFTSLWLHAHDIVIQNSAYNPALTPLSLRTAGRRRPAKEPGPKALPASPSAEHDFPASEMVDEASHGFRHIGGLTVAKARLEEIAAIFSDTEARSIYDISPSHFMLYGPPGTGKTTLVEALANQLNARLTKVPVNEVIEMWVGKSGRNLQEIFEKAKANGYPQVLLFDEFEALGSKSGRMTVSERVDVLKVFNTEIVDISNNHPNIIIAAATNADTHEIEPSLIRSGRLEPIQAGLPNDTERIDVWAAVLAKAFLKKSDVSKEVLGAEGLHRFLLYADDINPVELAGMTEGMTGADFEAILEHARRQCFTQYRQTGQHQQVTQQHLINGIAAVRQR